MDRSQRLYFLKTDFLSEDVRRIDMMQVEGIRIAIRGARINLIKSLCLFDPCEKRALSILAQQGCRVYFDTLIRVPEIGRLIRGDIEGVIRFSISI